MNIEKERNQEVMKNGTNSIGRDARHKTGYRDKLIKALSWESKKHYTKRGTTADCGAICFTFWLFLTSNFLPHENKCAIFIKLNITPSV